ncbi:MAG: hypothetical protein ACI9CO_001480 [Candidatus Azotimanducaceae bacterium]|jgi:hypothetical protein
MEHTKITTRRSTQTVLLAAMLPIILLVSAEDKPNNDWKVALGLRLAYALEYEGFDDSKKEALPYFVGFTNGYLLYHRTFSLGIKFVKNGIESVLKTRLSQFSSVRRISFNCCKLDVISNSVGF